MQPPGCACWRWRRRSSASSAGVGDLQAASECRRTTRECRGRTGRSVCLDTAGFIKATIGSCTVDHVKVTRVILLKHHFKVGCCRDVGKMHGAPFDVEDTVRRAARCGSENATGSTGKDRATRLSICAQVVLIRQNGRFPIDTRQYLATMGERSLGACQVQRSVRGDIDSAKCLPVNGQREWGCNFGCAIVAMVAGVSVARRDRASPSSRGVGTAAGRCPCRGRRWRTRSTGSVESEYIVGTACRRYADRQLRGPCRANPESATWVLPGCGRI